MSILMNPIHCEYGACNLNAEKCGQLIDKNGLIKEHIHLCKNHALLMSYFRCTCHTQLWRNITQCFDESEALKTDDISLDKIL